jgi:glucose/arabinose dehydrogenase
MKCRHAELPGDDHHGRRFIDFGPDGWLCVAVSAPCNVCEPKDERCGTMMRMRSEG